MVVSIDSQRGFTLIELVSVMVIVGVIAVTVSIRLTPSDFYLQSAKADILSAIMTARETAMSRTDGNSSITLIATNTAIDVRVNGVSINTLAETYPLTLNTNVRLSTGVGTLTFNTLGETASHSFTLEQGDFSESITISGVGYAY